MTVAFVPCELDHLAGIIPPAEAGVEDTRHNVLGDPGAADLLRVYARALIVEGRPIAILGISPRWTAVCYAWAILTEEALVFHPLLVTRETHRLLRHAETSLGMRRIEASVKVGYGAGIRWIEALGFRLEGVMRNFGPGGVGDFALYARTVQ